jgi:hypothetical protein
MSQCRGVVVEPRIQFGKPEEGEYLPLESITRGLVKSVICNSELYIVVTSCLYQRVR